MVSRSTTGVSPAICCSPALAPGASAAPAPASSGAAWIVVVCAVEGVGVVATGAGLGRSWKLSTLLPGKAEGSTRGNSLRPGARCRVPGSGPGPAEVSAVGTFWLRGAGGRSACRDRGARRTMGGACLIETSLPSFASDRPGSLLAETGRDSPSADPGALRTISASGLRATSGTGDGLDVSEPDAFSLSVRAGNFA